MVFPAGDHKQNTGIAAYRVTKTAVFSDGVGTGQAGTYALFTVTGAVTVRIIIECTDTLIEGVTGGTIEIGITGDTATIIAQTVSDTIAVNEIWHDATSDADIEAYSVMKDFIIVNGMDIFATIAAQTITAGTLVLYCFWTPLSSDGLVVAA